MVAGVAGTGVVKMPASPNVWSWVFADVGVPLVGVELVGENRALLRRADEAGLDGPLLPSRATVVEEGFDEERARREHPHRAVAVVDLGAWRQKEKTLLLHAVAPKLWL